MECLFSWANWENVGQALYCTYEIGKHIPGNVTSGPAKEVLISRRVILAFLTSTSFAYLVWHAMLFFSSSNILLYFKMSPPHTKSHHGHAHTSSSGGPGTLGIVGLWTPASPPTSLFEWSYLLNLLFSKIAVLEVWNFLEIQTFSPILLLRWFLSTLKLSNLCLKLLAFSIWIFEFIFFFGLKSSALFVSSFLGSK